MRGATPIFAYVGRIVPIVWRGPLGSSDRWVGFTEMLRTRS